MEPNKRLEKLSFNIETGKLLLSQYTDELSYQDDVTKTLESKANTQMQISGIILGLYGTMSTVFLVSFDVLLSANIYLLLTYFISVVITIFFMFCSLTYSILTIRVKGWERPIFYKPSSDDKMPEDKSETIEHVIKKSSQNEEMIIKESLIATAYCLTKNFDNNLKMSKKVKFGFYFIVLGLMGFLSSIIILVSVGVFIL